MMTFSLSRHNRESLSRGNREQNRVKKWLERGTVFQEKIMSSETQGTRSFAVLEKDRLN